MTPLPSHLGLFRLRPPTLPFRAALMLDTSTTTNTTTATPPTLSPRNAAETRQAATAGRSPRAQHRRRFEVTGPGADLVARHAEALMAISSMANRRDDASTASPREMIDLSPAQRLTRHC